MSPVAITLLVIVIVLAIIIAVLYFLGKKAQKKQAEQQELLEAVRRTIREELTGVSFTKTTTQPEQAGAVDEDVLGFLRALQEGDDTI